ncbi:MULTISPECIES: YlbF family regulator [Geobacillus]|uniref:YlbF family regulator n=1 Tax=Geobacillus zalihae TaxID=213419 RepID=A0A7H1RVP5_9BACL|nr:MULTISPECIES: YlbF family regulator [Geobacillus]OQP24750.1 regulator [Geobacillus zalihae]QNU18334.1 YlbF family regulator [Geobacillus zalihae]
MKIATLERIEILDKAEALAKMIVESDVADEYRRAFWRLKQDRRAQQLTARFVKLKERYEEVQRFGKYHPDYRDVMKEVREAKRELDLHETVAAFKEAEKAMQELLDEISVLIGKAVSEHVKVPTGNPYFLSAGCSGGCGAGGSCGCRT